MLKRLLLFVLSLAQILSFSACGKSKDKDGETDKKPNSSVGTSGDATQDFDDEWDEDQPTDEEREELKDLWGEMTDNAKPEISGGSSSTGSSSKNESTAGSSTGGSSSQGSSSVGSSSGSSSSEVTSSDEEDFKGIGTIGKVPGAIF